MPFLNKPIFRHIGFAVAVAGLLTTQVHIHVEADHVEHNEGELCDVFLTPSLEGTNPPTADEIQFIHGNTLIDTEVLLESSMHIGLADSRAPPTYHI